MDANHMKTVWESMLRPHRFFLFVFIWRPLLCIANVRSVAINPTDYQWMPLYWVCAVIITVHTVVSLFHFFLLFFKTNFFFYVIRYNLSIRLIHVYSLWHILLCAFLLYSLVEMFGEKTTPTSLNLSLWIIAHNNVTMLHILLLYKIDGWTERCMGVYCVCVWSGRIRKSATATTVINEHNDLAFYFHMIALYTTRFTFKKMLSVCVCAFVHNAYYIDLHRTAYTLCSKHEHTPIIPHKSNIRPLSCNMKMYKDSNIDASLSMHFYIEVRK